MEYLFGMAYGLIMCLSGHGFRTGAYWLGMIPAALFYIHVFEPYIVPLIINK